MYPRLFGELTTVEYYTDCSSFGKTEYIETVKISIWIHLTIFWVADSIYRSGLIWILYVMNFLMYCFIFIRLISGIKFKKFDEVFLILVILGFIGFYILWEIKSRYIYPIYPLLIVLSYMGFKDAYDFMLKRNLLHVSSLRKRV